MDMLGAGILSFIGRLYLNNASPVHTIHMYIYMYMQTLVCQHAHALDSHLLNTLYLAGVVSWGVAIDILTHRDRS